jgi:hypothetical protein
VTKNAVANELVLQYPTREVRRGDRVRIYPERNVSWGISDHYGHDVCPLG